MSRPVVRSLFSSSSFGSLQRYRVPFTCKLSSDAGKVTKPSDPAASNAGIKVSPLSFGLVCVLGMFGGHMLALRDIRKERHAYRLALRKKYKKKLEDIKNMEDKVHKS